MTENIGVILKCVSGFYYVRSEDNKIFECKARGLFRKDGIKPVAGDKVKFSVNEDGINVITEVRPRKNILIRPPIANLDQAFIVSSTLEPKLNLFFIDKLTVICTLFDIVPIVVFSKTDLKDASSEAEIYKKSGISAFCVSRNNNSIMELKQLLNGRTSAFVGNSGVGKSTIMNCLFKNLSLSTDKISKKLGRGKHTTRQVELFPFENGYVADTPGFSSMDLIKNMNINKETLAQGFGEFKKFIGECEFNSCTHTRERGCRILEAVNQNEISLSRHESYLKMYDEIKDFNRF